MPLTWSIANCADWESLKTDDEWPITNTMILLMPVIAIGKITEANAAEVYARLRLVEQLNDGGMMTEWGRKGCDLCDKLGHHDLKFTPAMVHARIGLSCNVINETWATFQKRMLKWVRPDLEREYKNAIKEVVSVTVG